MKQTTLEIICCPTCHSMLSLSTNVESENIERGDLYCSTCDRKYPIQNGIAQFIQPDELEGSNQHFERYYNRLAPFYFLFSKFAFLPFGGERKARQEILDRLEMADGRVLEVSIGNGVNLPYLFKMSNSSEIFGIDLSIGMLSKCEKLVNKRAWSVDLCLSKAEAIPFKDERFENILHIGGINFFSNKEKAIEEMIRVAQPGGKIVIADEAERFAKQVNRNVSPPSQDLGGGDVETTIHKLVPDTMLDIRLDGIWKVHGKFHGYCLEFRKPFYRVEDSK